MNEFFNKKKPLELPDELLLYILSYLDIKSLNFFALVSQKNYRLSKNATLWKTHCEYSLTQTSPLATDESYQQLFTNTFKKLKKIGPSDISYRLTLISLEKNFSKLTLEKKFTLDNLKKNIAGFTSPLQIALNYNAQPVLDFFYNQCDKEKPTGYNTQELAISCRQLTLSEFKKAYNGSPEKIFSIIVNYGITHYLNALSSQMLASVDAINGLFTALHLKHFNFAKKLITLGVSINSTNKLGQLSITRFAKMKPPKIDQIKFLIEHGADLTIKDNNGDSYNVLAEKNSNLSLENPNIPNVRK